MSDGVAIPAWLLVLMAALALWALYEHVLAPALRFLVTHPANQVIDELGERLRIGIRPFQRTKRQALIHSLLADRKVQAAAEQFARDKGVALPAALRRVERYAREIVPAFNAYFYFRIGYWIGRWIARSLYRVRIGYLDSEGIAKIGPEATVVFVMNHRSNMERPHSLSRRRPGGALLRRGRVGAHLAAFGADPRHGRLLRAPRLEGRALPARARALYRDGDRGGRAAGALPRGRPHARRPHARAPARRDRLHDARLSHGGRARSRVRAAGDQLRPRARGPEPAARARPERSGCGPREGSVERARFRRAQPEIDAEERVVPFRLRLRQFRRPGLDARLLPGAAWISSGSRARSAGARRRRSGSTLCARSAASCRWCPCR
jgi:hypothetical protein